MKKVIYETESTRVPSELVQKVRDVYEKRKVNEPKLRMIDVWYGLLSKVK